MRSALGTFLRQRREARDWTRQHVVEVLGYKNTNKDLRRIDSLEREGEMITCDSPNDCRCSCGAVRQH